MNILDREIMKAVLIDEEQSIYKINEFLKENRGIKTNYPTVWRHIKKMQKEDLLYVNEAFRKNGKPDERETEILKLTNKGLATLLIEGDLQKEELFSVGRKIFDKYFKKLPSLAEPFMTDIFADTLLEIKPKVNLKFFDEEWFREIYKVAFRNSAIKAIEKYRDKFERKGIWATAKELKENPPPFEKLLDDLINGKVKLKVKNTFDDLGE